MILARFGELTRTLHKPVLSLSLNDFKKMTQFPPKNNEYHFRIDQVEILRNRPDAVTPCNMTLLDDDAYYRHNVIHSVNCTPCYWKHFSAQLPVHANMSNLPDCVYKHQFLHINRQYLPDDNVQNATKLYLRPCNEMTAAISTTKYTVGNSNKLILQFNFVHEAYKVSQNYIINQPTSLNDSFTYLLRLRYRQIITY